VSGRVRLIILVGEEEPTDQEWLQAASKAGSFDFLGNMLIAVYTGSMVYKDARPVAW
jgi:hypothetical protein